jgi:hypothetical protein
MVMAAVGRNKGSSLNIQSPGFEYIHSSWNEKEDDNMIAIVIITEKSIYHENTEFPRLFDKFESKSFQGTGLAFVYL